MENLNEKSFVVNLHVLENCNFRCKYCFSKFESKKILSLLHWKNIVDNICETIKVERFNIAGGEPLLYPKLEELINYIYNKGTKVSIITNGMLLNESFILNNKNKIETIGISIDSFNKKILNDLGCFNNRKEFMDKERFVSIANIIKSNNINLKVNTVVNKYNFNEKLVDDLSSLKVDRWKVLKMKDLKNDKFDNTFLSIRNEDFLHFINLNKSTSLNPIIEESMVNTYIIIDSNGNLVDNSREDKYKMVADAKSKTFKEDFFKFNLNLSLYNERYKDKK